MAKIPTKHIIDIEELHPADHVIITKRRLGFLPFQRHGISMSVDPIEGKFSMLHYKKPGLFSPIEMGEWELNFEEAKKDGIFVVQYGEGECLDDQRVLERATKCIGRKDFDLLNRTSKHIALHCKVGSNPIKAQSEMPEGYADTSTEDQKEVNIAATSLPRIDLEIPRTRIETIDELHEADHIFLTKAGKEYHGIVMSVKEESREFGMLCYCLLSGEDARKAKEELAKRTASGDDLPTIEKHILPTYIVQEETLSFDYASNKSLTRIEYEDFDCLGKDEVLRRAASCIGLGGFHLAKQTSEHIAYFCKIGHPIMTVPMDFEEITDDISAFDHPRVPVTSIHQLSRADHVVYDRGLYGHHGIIVDVFPEKSEYRVIHYTSPKEEGGPAAASAASFTLSTKAIIKNQIKKFDEKKDVGQMFVVQYETDQCQDADDVIAAAEQFVGKEDYNLLLRNCECMALFCKTGIEKTEQVRRLLSKIQYKFNTLHKFTLPAVVGNLADDLVTGITRVGVTSSGRALGAGAAVGGVFEVIAAGLEIYFLEKQRREARIPEKKYHAKLATRTVAASTAVGGGVAGLAIGMPFGPIGMLVGGMIGGFVGAVVPNGVLYGVEKTGYLEEPIYDTTKRREEE